MGSEEESQTESVLLEHRCSCSGVVLWVRSSTHIVSHPTQQLEKHYNAPRNFVQSDGELLVVFHACLLRRLKVLPHLSNNIVLHSLGVAQTLNCAVAFACAKTRCSRMSPTLLWYPY
ncbi:hypothetical protein O9929_07330 [Vibrio lentus]|nr:hypothetical protein [Vibrio lentus]